jgi:hypothetical protein
MKKIDVGQFIAILANLGVLAGIAFLAVELRQSNELISAEARFNMLATRTEPYTLQITERDLPEILVKDRNGLRRFSLANRYPMFWRCAEDGA